MQKDKKEVFGILRKYLILRQRYDIIEPTENQYTAALLQGGSWRDCNMTLTEEMGLLGADVDDAMKRFSGKTSFYERMLKKLPAAIESNPVLSFMDAKDYTTATANAHTLKGVFGNLSVTPLYTAYTTIVNDLRANEPEKAEALLKEILPLQEKFVSCILSYS